MYFFINMIIFLGVFVCVLCFLESSYLLSSLCLSLSVVFFSPLVSLGCGRWYAFYVVLLFLSGIFSLMVFLCSLGSVGYGMDFVFYILGFFILFLFLFFSEGFYGSVLISDSGDLWVMSDYNYFFIFFVVFVLLLLLNIISYLVSASGSLRGL